jgi:tellurite resistance protein TehA-like permease
MCSLITCDVCHKLTWSGCGQDIQLHSKELMKEVNPGDRCTCGEKKRFPRPLSKLSRPIEAIRQFTPSWFSMTMGTGILSVLLQVFPFQFNGLHTIAVIIFVLNVVIYCTFTIMTVARYVMFPSVLSLMLNHSAQSLFIGTMPMGLTTIINFIIVGLPQHFDWALDLAFVLWCIDLAFTLICCIGVPYFIIVHHNHQIESMNGTWLLPIVPAVVHSASGGLLANHIDENRAFVVLIISYLLMGMGILLAISIIVIYFYRLAVHKLPPKEVIISVFLPLGPVSFFFFFFFFAFGNVINLYIIH